MEIHGNPNKGLFTRSSHARRQACQGYDIPGPGMPGNDVVISHTNIIAKLFYGEKKMQVNTKC